MRFIADLHIHSPFSRATSKESNIAGLFSWSRVKGINLLGTGDFTHPGWQRQLKEMLVPDGDTGFFKLRNEDILPALPETVPEAIPVRFILSAEISSIYKKDDKVRKIHNILYVPDFASAERMSSRLAAIGNIESDGRPILGLNARNLLEILLEQAPDGFLVPAHIWTPWFSLFGSKSGFDRIEECFEDLTPHIFALETGLSSDPAMNRLISALDGYSLISNSDCHSPGKLGREANIFDTEFTYRAMRDALKNPHGKAFSGTIEFFPEEGKYHCDGHRKCNVCLEPKETRDLHDACPVCGRPLTIGVLHRVMDLADREEPLYSPGSPAVHSLIPLPEVLGELVGAGPATKGVMAHYTRLIHRFGSEFNILLNATLDELNSDSPLLAEAVRRMRAGHVIRQAGYDGEFGIIRVFEPNELDSLRGQADLFGGRVKKTRKKECPSMTAAPRMAPASPSGEAKNKTRQLNPEQERAINDPAEKILVAAGPGTGKTYTLVERLNRILAEGKAEPGECVVITFTNRAADEISARLADRFGNKAEGVFVGTFHRFCLEELRRIRPNLAVAGEESREMLLASLFPEKNGAELSTTRKAIALYCQQISMGETPETDNDLQRYLSELHRRKAVELDLLIPAFVEQLRGESSFRENLCGRIRQLFVDEFQDVNHAQYSLVRLLGQGADIFAIGDPDQAIYGFRGSNLRFFFSFCDDFSIRPLHLTRNYRSGPAIVQAATAVISHNRTKNASPLTAALAHPASIDHYLAPTPQAEAEYIVSRIEKAVGGVSSFSINTGRGGETNTSEDKSFSDIAILFRLSAQAPPLIEALERRGIPFQIVGDTPYYLRPELKAAYYWIRNACQEVSPGEQLALLRHTRTIGAAAIRQLEATLPLTGADCFEEALKLSLSTAGRDAVLALRSGLEIFRKTTAAKGISLALSQSLPLLSIAGDSDSAQRFVGLAGTFGSDLNALAGHLTSNAAATAYDPCAESVALLTMHAAKGLEFPVVFLAGLEETIMPCTYIGTGNVEEERRLFYVAMTRAMQDLHLSSAVRRSLYGRTEEHPVSRFVKEIPIHLVTKIQTAPTRKHKKRAVQMSLF